MKFDELVSVIKRSDIVRMHSFPMTIGEVDRQGIEILARLNEIADDKDTMGDAQDAILNMMLLTLNQVLDDPEVKYPLRHPDVQGFLMAWWWAVLLSAQCTAKQKLEEDSA